MALTLADYEVLFHGSEFLNGINNSNRLFMRWDPPSSFVPGTSKAKPYLTWQMWISEPGGYQVLLNGAPVHSRSPVVAGQVHTASHFLDGNALARGANIEFRAFSGCKLRVEAVMMHFQQRR